MKRAYHILLVSLIAIISFECQKDFSSDRTIAPNNGSSPITATVQGNIVDEYGSPEPGVKVTAGTANTVTDNNGYFRITAAALDKNGAVITAEKIGYFKAYRSFRATRGTNQLGIKLIRKTLTGTINAAMGGVVSMSNGVKVLLPANGIMRLTGQAFTGLVEVYAAYIDPTSNDIGTRVPGSFMGDDQKNERVVLSSFGMMAVELQSSSGEKLQIAAGSTATLTVPVPTSTLLSAPATIPLWYVDEQTGIWKEQGSAKKEGNYYVGTVQHFSYWNCDLGVPAISFTATFKTANNAVLKNLYLRVRTLDDTSRGYAHGYTDSLGQASGLIPSNKSLVLEVLDQCYKVMYYKNIGPFSQNVDLGTIVVPNASSSIITITGRLIGCNNMPVSDGYAAIYSDNFVSYVKTDATGKFITTITKCSGSQLDFELVGIDKANRQQGNMISIPVTGPAADLGDVSACGVSSIEYINYTLDGVDYSITSIQTDSISSFDYALPGNKFQVHIGGGHLSNRLDFNFVGTAVPGVYPVGNMSVINMGVFNDSVQLNKPFNVTITAYPQHNGEFYEGNFSGSFKYLSSLSLTHTINSTFRVKKR